MRITLDLDHTNEDTIRGKAVLLKRAFPQSKVRYRISSSGEGGHVEVLDAPVGEEEMYMIRRLFGDHDLRIAIDLSRYKLGKYKLPMQVLFDFKIKDGVVLRAGQWKEVS